MLKLNSAFPEQIEIRWMVFHRARVIKGLFCDRKSYTPNCGKAAVWGMYPVRGIVLSVFRSFTHVAMLRAGTENVEEGFWW
jgi:hypothetical protein